MSNEYDNDYDADNRSEYKCDFCLGQLGRTVRGQFGLCVWLGFPFYGVAATCDRKYRFQSEKVAILREMAVSSTRCSLSVLAPWNHLKPLLRRSTATSSSRKSFSMLKRCLSSWIRNGRFHKSYRLLLWRHSQQTVTRLEYGDLSGVEFEEITYKFTGSCSSQVTGR